MINKTIIYKFFEHFSKHRKKTDRSVVFNQKPLLVLESQMRASNNLENKIPSDTY